MSRKLAALGCGILLVTALAGCTSAADGTPVSVPGDASSSAQPTTTTVEDNKAPQVKHPLDATRFLTAPCTVLTSAQLATLDISTPGEPETTGAVAEQAGPMCSWFTDGSRDLYDIGFLTGNKNGLSDTYRGTWNGYFEPTDVDGYPAVFNDVVDGRDGGRCNMTVGVNDNLAFRTQLTADIGRQTCDGAKNLARLVLATIKAGG